MPASNQPASSQPASNQPASSQPATSQSFRRLWLAPRAIALHVVILAVIPTFAALCDWQVHRALAGNDLSWAYVFEWPFFAGYAVYMWWRFIHEEPAVLPGSGPRPTLATSDGPPPALAATGPGETAEPSEPDPDAADRAAYNRYLAELAAQDERKRRSTY
jgi:hypothetical protein